MESHAIVPLPHCPSPLPHDQGAMCQAEIIEQNCNVLIRCCQELCSGHWEESQTCDMESREICIHVPGSSSLETESGLFREERAEGRCDRNLQIKKKAAAKSGGINCPLCPLELWQELILVGEFIYGRVHLVFGKNSIMMKIVKLCYCLPEKMGTFTHWRSVNDDLRDGIRIPAHGWWQGIISMTPSSPVFQMPLLTLLGWSIDYFCQHCHIVLSVSDLGSILFIK